MPTWPLTLPQSLLRQSYQEGMAESRVFSNTDAGPGKIRPGSSARPRPVAGSVEMTSAQLEILEAFVATDLVKGTEAFDFPAQRGSGTWLVRFTKEGLPRWTPLGSDLWLVELGLEVLP